MKQSPLRHSAFLVLAFFALACRPGGGSGGPQDGRAATSGFGSFGALGGSGAHPGIGGRGFGASGAVPNGGTWGKGGSSFAGTGGSASEGGVESGGAGGGDCTVCP